jgi:hypothetical protein
MHRLAMPLWIHDMHLPNRHETLERLDQLVHDRRFWAIVAVTALLTAFIALVIWAGVSGGPA